MRKQQRGRDAKQWRFVQQHFLRAWAGSHCVAEAAVKLRLPRHMVLVWEAWLHRQGVELPRLLPRPLADVQALLADQLLPTGRWSGIRWKTTIFWQDEGVVIEAEHRPTRRTYRLELSPLEGSRSLVGYVEVAAGKWSYSISCGGDSYDAYRCRRLYEEWDGRPLTRRELALMVPPARELYHAAHRALVDAPADPEVSWPWPMRQ